MCIFRFIRPFQNISSNIEPPGDHDWGNQSAGKISVEPLQTANSFHIQTGPGFEILKLDINNLPALMQSKAKFTTIIIFYVELKHFEEKPSTQNAKLTQQIR